MFIASKGTLPLPEWQHNPNMKDEHGKTVEYYLQLHDINVPE